MSDSTEKPTPYFDDTHAACHARLVAYDGNAKCCFCVPHDGCKLIRGVTKQPDLRDSRTSDELVDLAMRIRTGYFDSYWEASNAIIALIKREKQQAVKEVLQNLLDGATPVRYDAERYPDDPNGEFDEAETQGVFAWKIEELLADLRPTEADER